MKRHPSRKEMDLKRNICDETSDYISGEMWKSYIMGRKNVVPDEKFVIILRQILYE